VSDNPLATVLEEDSLTCRNPPDGICT